MSQDIDREDMADEHDRASRLELLEMEQRLLTARKSARRTQEPDEHGAYLTLDCVQCGSEIGIDRLKVAIKNTLCIDCATWNERRR